MLLISQLKTHSLIDLRPLVFIALYEIGYNPIPRVSISNYVHPVFQQKNEQNIGKNLDKRTPDKWKDLQLSYGMRENYVPYCALYLSYLSHKIPIQTANQIRLIS